MNRPAPAALAALVLIGGCGAKPSAAVVAARLAPPPSRPVATLAPPIPVQDTAQNSAQNPPQNPAQNLAQNPGTFAGPTVSAVSPRAEERGTPETRVGAANRAARIEPAGADYDLSAQVYAYAPHALYQVYATPGRITDIALQPGEALSGEGAIAAGDTARWIIGESVSGAGDQARTHILLKPTRADLATNLVLHTDRRTYLIELQARPDVYMASVAWRYPHDEVLAVARAATQAAARQAEPTVDLSRLDFGYRIEGDGVPWRPLRAFDDGARVYIEFAQTLDAAVLPPLFLRPAGSDTAALVNYRIEGRRLIVDRLFDAAELRLVEGRRDRSVRILRTGDRP